MSREPTPTWFFAMVIVRKESRFLLVQEARHGQGWYLPAGRIEPGENWSHGALRETLEESGVAVKLEGVARVEYRPAAAGARVRIFFVASPTDNRPPKSTADEHSLQARWVTLEEMAQLPLRDTEVFHACTYVARNGPIAPLSLLALEGSSWL